MKYDAEELREAADYAEKAGFNHEAAAIRYAVVEAERIRGALDKSIKIQSHYAKLLNGYDGGKRMTFSNSQKWIERLEKIKEIQ